MAQIAPFLSLALASGLLAGVVAWALPRFVHRRTDTPPIPLDHLGEPRVFVFRDGYLVSAEHGARFLLPDPVDRLAAWDDLRAALEGLLPGAGSAMDRLTTQGASFQIAGPWANDRLHLIGVRDGAELRLTLSAGDADDAAVRVDRTALTALEAETALLGRSAATSPTLAWVTDPDGRVVWANELYGREATMALGPEAGTRWPLPDLFERGEAVDDPTGRRVLRGSDGEERWFEVVQGATADGLRHWHATPLSRVVEVEANLRRFGNMLTNSFALLPTGLAIFDADRHLVVFNPPLLDMTSLDPVWLAGQPHLSEVLDAMREAQRLPEPRDWRSWRDGLLAADGAREPWIETWTLPCGQTLRMSARPQGDGAVALLLQDVTAEMTLARRRRSDAEVLHALLDASGDAVAAFGPEGEALHLNTHLRDLIDLDAEALPTLPEVIARLSERFHPSPVWGELRDLARAPTPSADWAETLHHPGGEALSLHVLPLPEGRLALRLSGDLAALHGLRREAEIAPEGVAPEHQDAARDLVRLARGEPSETEEAIPAADAPGGRADGAEEAARAAVA